MNLEGHRSHLLKAPGILKVKGELVANGYPALQFFTVARVHPF